jgi:hypothetical protein
LVQDFRLRIAAELRVPVKLTVSLALALRVDTVRHAYFSLPFEHARSDGFGEAARANGANAIATAVVRVADRTTERILMRTSDCKLHGRRGAMLTIRK